MEKRFEVTAGDLSKRFYAAAAVIETDNAFAIALDGKPARTRMRAPLAAATRALAEAIAEEWRVQGEKIDFGAMPMTRYQMTVIDRAGQDASMWRGVTLSFLATDLLCYRAAAPDELVRRQSAGWDPLLQWAASEGVRLNVGQGAGFIAQPPDALSTGAALLGRAPDPAQLAIKEAAEIAGSAVIALALWRRVFTAEALFEASRVDETFQAEKWGSDREAETRARRMKSDFLNAARYLSLTAAFG